MPNALEAIHQELRRLQHEGIQSVFVSDQTSESLNASTAPTERFQQQTTVPTSIPPGNTEPAKAVDNSATAGDPIKQIPTQAAEFKLPDAPKKERLNWLREHVENCPVCNEHLSPDGKVVFGAGSVSADIFFCGEAPGADEERTGEPFVGKAGQLLNKIIQTMGLNRESVYIANILKWRPEHDKPYGNRPPTIAEMQFCLPYVRAQIEIIQPKVIVALGNTAVTGLLGPDPTRRMSSARGTWDTFQNTPLMITFHPSYLLRNDTLHTKRLVWEDMLQVMDKVGLPISEKQHTFFLPK